MGNLTRPTILPPNASPLMRAVDQAVPQWGHLPGHLAGGIYGHPEALGPWLAAEWGISQFARYFNGNTDLITAGVPWLLQRGTAAAVRRAMGWLGLTTGVVIEEDGALLHIDPGQMLSVAQVQALAHVVRASVPAHVHFYRVFHGLDDRPLRWDMAPKWDNAVWEFESGTPVDVDPWGDPVIVSQMTTMRRWAPRPQRAVYLARTRCSARPYIRWPHWRWDWLRWDETPPPSLKPKHTRTLLRATLLPVYQRPPAGSRVTAVATARHMPRPLRQPITQRTATRATVVPAYSVDPTWLTPGTWDARPWAKTIPRQSTTTP